MAVKGIEIRNIEEREGAVVAALWNRMACEVPDGGPLPPYGEERIGRMLSACAWHHFAFCLVALEAGGGDVVGFLNARVDPGDGLLPPLVGEVECLYVVPERRGRGIGRALARDGIAELRARGAHTVRTQAASDEPLARRFWERLGFEADMVTLSLYQPES